MTETTEVEDVRDLAERSKVQDDRHFGGAREILVPTDLTVESRKAIGYAIGLAKTLHAHLTLLHVYKEPYSLEYMRGPDICGAREQQRRYTENALELLGKQTKEEYANCSTLFREGALCQEIANSVKELQADLVVITTRGNKWVQRVAYGCDADAIVRLSPCPVLVVHRSYFKTEIDEPTLYGVTLNSSKMGYVQTAEVMAKEGLHHHQALAEREGS